MKILLFSLARIEYFVRFNRTRNASTYQSKADTNLITGKAMYDTILGNNFNIRLGQFYNANLSLKSFASITC